MVTILEIVFGIWFLLALLVVAFIRGSNLRTPPSGRAQISHEQEISVRAGLSAWRRPGSDVG